MRPKSPRIAVRGIIMQQDRLLLVNAFRAGLSDLWCAPGGGAIAGQSLPENLMREVHEETGLRIAVGAPALVNEFYDPASAFHQVEVFFRCTIQHGQIDAAWRDPENIVTERQFFSRNEIAKIRLKPDLLPAIAWQDGGLHYDPLERLVR